MIIKNAYDAMIKMNNLSDEIEKINDRMRICKPSDMKIYNELEREADRKYSEFLSIKYTLQSIKMPIVIQ